MTFEEYRELHKRLWGWLTENPMAHKWNWPEWESFGGKVEEVGSNCFACEYDNVVAENKGEKGNCHYCPIEWSAQNHCNVSGSEFRAWANCTDPAERSRLAAVIRDMPWTEKE